MAENYKHLYEQMKNMVAMYQDEIVPGLRKTIEEMERNRVEVVRCKDCKHMYRRKGLRWCDAWGEINGMGDDGFCNYGERRGEENAGS